MSDEYDCPYCDASFDSKQGVSVHQGYKHDMPYEDEATMRELYVDERMSIPEIADELDAGETTIEQWLDKHGIDTRDRGGKPDDAAYKDADRLRELYFDEGLSRRQIAERLGCTEGDVRYHFEKHGIMPEPEPWHDAEQLRERLDDTPIDVLAAEWGCSTSTLRRWHGKHGLDVEIRYDASNSVPYSLIFDEEYNQTVFVHQLVAYAHGKLEYEDMFDTSVHVHHKDENPWNNAPENLEALSVGEHMAKHHTERLRRQ